MKAADPARTMADIALLYELSLAVGTSLDLQTCCEGFIATLMARKNLSYASVWLFSEESDCALVYALPQLHVGETVLPTDHPLLTRAHGGAYTVSVGEPGFEDVCLEARLEPGTHAVFPLEEIGVLKLHAPAGSRALGPLALRQLAPVVAKFAAALRACEGHRRMLEALEGQGRLERRLAQSARLEALGRLAGGVAHDFNNLLSAVSAYSELLVLEPGNPERVGSYSARILSACDRASELTKQLLAFGPSGSTERKAVDLNEVVREVAVLLGPAAGEGIRVWTRVADRPAVVKGDAATLHAMVLNLAMNAADAQPDGGEIGLELSREDDEWVLSVSDQGVGMDAHTKGHLFDPFFTTKAQGKGTGLGLATVYGTTQAHGGSIDVQTELGVGSRFSVRLPAASDRVAPSTPPSASRGTVQGLRVLLVDDELLPRQAAAEMLRQLGCAVTEAPDGAVALSLFEPTRFDLVVLDLMMPGMDGAQLLRALRQVDPGVQAVMASAFGHPRLVAGLREQAPNGFLRKPYRLEALSRELERLV